MSLREMIGWQVKDLPRISAYYGKLPIYFVRQFESYPGISAAALEFTILTASRTNEVLGAIRSKIGFDNRIWTIPAHRMKVGRAHRVPLSQRAIEILRVMEKVRNGEAVFPGVRSGKHLSNMAMLSVLRRMGRKDLTAHGFRGTVHDWVSEKMDFQRVVAEMALAHSIGSTVEAAFRRGDLLDKRRALMSIWAAYCGMASEVVTLKTSA